jgi:hypothetical protein
MNIKRISDKITTVLRNENLQEIATEFTEVFVDAKLAEGVLKELPVTNILIGTFKALTSIQDALFVNKLSAFLNEIKDIPLEEREEMISKIDSSEKYRTKVGEKLMYIIDKCDDTEKAQLTAILLKAVALKKIDYDSFLRCALVIERCMLDELKEFVLHDEVNYSIEYYSDYLSWGLLEFAPFYIELEETNSYDEFNSKEYKLHNGNLALRLSWAGKKIRENLREFVKSNDDTFNITTYTKTEVENHLKDIFKIYLKEEHRHKLENVIKTTLIQMMNNPKISKEDFFELAYSAIEKTETDITVYNQYMKDHYNKLAALDIKFDFQFWLDFKEEYNVKYLETLMKNFK